MKMIIKSYFYLGVMAIVLSILIVVPILLFSYLLVEIDK